MQFFNTNINKLNPHFPSPGLGRFADKHFSNVITEIFIGIIVFGLLNFAKQISEKKYSTYGTSSIFAHNLADAHLQVIDVEILVVSVKLIMKFISKFCFSLRV